MIKFPNETGFGVGVNEKRPARGG